MLRQWQHVLGLGAALTSLTFGATFGGTLTVYLSYALAVALGVVIYQQGDQYATAGTVTGNVLLGYLAAVALTLVLATGLLVWRLNVPAGFGAWQMGLMMWDSWAGLGAATLSGFFLAGLAGLAT